MTGQGKAKRSNRPSRKQSSSLIRAALARLGWTQTRLALEAQNAAPAGMRIGADSISHYVNERYLPSPEHAVVLEAVLKLEPGTLRGPELSSRATGREINAAVRDLGDGKAWLTINEAVPWKIAIGILGLLRGDQTAKSNRS